MSEPFIGEIRSFGFTYAPRGWAFCNGQLLNISQNQALFSLLGTTYGGDGRTTFALPDLRGRAPVHRGNGVVQGESAGEELHALTAAEMPIHSHLAAAIKTAATTSAAAGNLWAQLTVSGYTTAAPDAVMNPASLSAAGGGVPHNNMQPYSVMNYCIATQGIFPSRS